MPDKSSHDDLNSPPAPAFLFSELTNVGVGESRDSGGSNGKNGRRRKMPSYVSEIGFDFEPDEGTSEEEYVEYETDTDISAPSDDILAQTISNPLDPFFTQKAIEDSAFRYRLEAEPELVEKLSRLDKTVIEQARQDDSFFRQIINDKTEIIPAAETGATLKSAYEKTAVEDGWLFNNSDSDAMLIDELSGTPASEDKAGDKTHVFSEAEKPDSYFRKALPEDESSHTDLDPTIFDQKADMAYKQEKLVDSLFDGKPVESDSININADSFPPDIDFSHDGVLPPDLIGSGSGDGHFGSNLETDEGPVDIMANLHEEVSDLPPDDDAILDIFGESADGAVYDQSIRVRADSSNAALPAGAGKPHLNFSESFSDMKWVESEDGGLGFESDGEGKSAHKPRERGPSISSGRELPDENAEWGSLPPMPESSLADDGEERSARLEDDDVDDILNREPAPQEQVASQAPEPRFPAETPFLDDMKFDSQAVELPEELPAASKAMAAGEKLDKDDDLENIFDSAAQQEVAEPKGVAVAGGFSEEFSVDSLFGNAGEDEDVEEIEKSENEFDS
ncbi:MAG: hypothetical protein JXR97_04325, partial [Planctomycetes bacterium]|nr:hypothetical protein [Planctomycetota bacterium]